MILLTSAAISFTRTIIFQAAAVLLPLIREPDGVWAPVIVSGELATVVSAF